MDNATARVLCALNNEFYAREALSFSATREAPWPGWRRVLGAIVAACDADAGERMRIVDVACGNMRFERFLDAECPRDFLALAADSCDRLALDALDAHDFERGAVSYAHVDVIEQLLDGGVQGLSLSLGAKGADAAVGFGFMHHIPGKENRANFIGALLETVRPGGIVAVSLWRFMDDERLAPKAREATERARSYVADAVSGRAPLDEETARSALFALDFARFEEGDYLLGWQNDAAAFRYCHSFSDGEIEALISSVAGRASLVDRFTSDGKSGRLNEYLVFCRG